MSKSQMASAAWRAEGAKVTSTAALVTGPTRDGHPVRLALAVVYAHRGRDARRIIIGEYARDFYPLLGVDAEATTSDPATADDHAEHTWWPGQVHLCATLSSVCREAGLHALGDFDANDLEKQDAAKNVADAVAGHVRAWIAEWGALSVVAMTRAWPVIGADGNAFAASLRWSALAPTMSSFADATMSVAGLPDAGDAQALRDFYDLTGFRDAALKKAVAAGTEPYSYDGVRDMARRLRVFEEYALCHERPTLVSGVRAMRRSLYASPCRL